MNAIGWLEAVLVVSNIVGLPALAIWFVRDRKITHAAARKAEAEGAVAEGTVKSVVDLSSISSLEAQVGLITKAYEAERASMVRRITDLEERLQKSEAREEALRDELAKLREMVDHLTRYRVIEDEHPQAPDESGQGE